MDPKATFDLYRMVIGEHSPLFLLEIIVRTLVIYAYTLLLLRWLGQRAVGQLSMVEFLLVIALGSAVGDAMFYPEVPLLHAMLVITAVVSFDKLIDFAGTRSSAVERLIEGQPVELIKNGIIDPRKMDDVGLSRQELFEQLRLKEIQHLGQVAACYFEPCGSVSIFKADPNNTAEGLRIMPPWEVSEPTRFAGRISGGRNVGLVCMVCGSTCGAEQGRCPETCANCGRQEWTALQESLK